MLQTLQLILTFAAVLQAGAALLLILLRGSLIVSGGKANPTIQVKFNTSLELSSGAKNWKRPIIA